MSARNKQRGYELEREVVLAAEAAGLEAKRIFGSGAFKQQLGDDFAGDVVVEGLRIECKRRKNGFKIIMDAFDQDDADIVVVRADRSPRLWVLRESVVLGLLERAKGENHGS